MVPGADNSSKLFNLDMFSGNARNRFPPTTKFRKLSHSHNSSGISFKQFPCAHTSERRETAGRCGSAASDSQPIPNVRSSSASPTTTPERRINYYSTPEARAIRPTRTSPVESLAVPNRSGPTSWSLSPFRSFEAPPWACSTRSRIARRRRAIHDVSPSFSSVVSRDARERRAPTRRTRDTFSRSMTTPTRARATPSRARRGKRTKKGFSRRLDANANARATARRRVKKEKGKGGNARGRGRVLHVASWRYLYRGRS